MEISQDLTTQLFFFLTFSSLFLINSKKNKIILKQNPKIKIDYFNYLINNKQSKSIKLKYKRKWNRKVNPNDVAYKNKHVKMRGKITCFFYLI